MNQILNVKEIKPPSNGQKDKAKQPREFNVNVSQVIKIVRFFAIALIVFGIFNIGTGSYALIKNKQEAENAIVKPEIMVQEAEDNQLEITVSSKSVINDVYYSWNGNDEVRINGNGRNVVTQLIPFATGENILSIRATDTRGQTAEYQQAFSREANIVIDIEDVAPNAKITIESVKELQYMTYRWNNEQETTVEINDTTFEQEIPLKMGNNKLTITAVDVDGEEESAEERLTGYEAVDKPTINLTTDGTANYVITASDANGLTRIEYKNNGGETQTQEINNEKQFNITVPIIFLENQRSTMEVTVYSVTGQSVTSKGYIEPRK